MNIKSFFLGVLTCIVPVFVGLFVAGLVYQKPYDFLYQRMRTRVSYENKTETSFKVLRVLGHSALAKEVSDTVGDSVLYLGNTVLLLGDNYYKDQVVNVEEPLRVGTFNYISNGGRLMRLPVIGGQME